MLGSSPTKAYQFHVYPVLEPRIRIIDTVSVQAETASEPCLRVQSSRHISLNLLGTRDLLIESYSFLLRQDPRKECSGHVIYLLKSRILQLLFPNMLSISRPEALSASQSLIVAIGHIVP